MKVIFSLLIRYTCFRFNWIIEINKIRTPLAAPFACENRTVIFLETIELVGPYFGSDDDECIVGTNSIDVIYGYGGSVCTISFSLLSFRFFFYFSWAKVIQMYLEDVTLKAKIVL